MECLVTAEQRSGPLQSQTRDGLYRSDLKAALFDGTEPEAAVSSFGKGTVLCCFCARWRGYLK